MASIQMSGIGITEVVNKLGNVVFMRNKGGQTSRAWVYPTNTASAARTNTRNNFATCYSLWPAVTADEAEQWRLFGQRFTKRNSIAQTYRPSGRNIFVECNMNLLIALQSPISAPVFNAYPVPVASATVTTLTVASIYLLPSFMNFGSIVPTDLVCIVSASPSISAGIHYPRNNFLPISVITSGIVVSSYDFFTDYTSMFPAPVTGSRVMFKISLVHSLSGVRSVVLLCSAIVP